MENRAKKVQNDKIKFHNSYRKPKPRLSLFRAQRQIVYRTRKFFTQSSRNLSHIGPPKSAGSLDGSQMNLSINISF